jgi:hypothetical protein
MTILLCKILQANLTTSIKAFPVATGRTDTVVNPIAPRRLSPFRPQPPSP